MRSQHYTNKSDKFIDRGRAFDDALNALPAVCAKCGFVDLDFLPKKYKVLYRLARVPSEVTEAAVGNLLVKDRVARILKLVVSKQCRFNDTWYDNVGEQSPWTLVIPKPVIELNRVTKKVPRCNECGQPSTAHPGSQLDEWLWISESDPAYGLTDSVPTDLKLFATSPRTRYEACRETEFDIFKSQEWTSLATSGVAKWQQVDRQLYISVRVLELFRRCKVKTTMQTPDRDGAIKLNEDELAWVESKLKLIEDQGIPLFPDGETSPKDLKWLRSFFKSNKGSATTDVKSFEKQYRIKVPKTYRQFLESVGAMTFFDVDGEEGFESTVRLPDASEMKAFQDKTKGRTIPFAMTTHGDSFCFELDAEVPEPEVLYYNHEMDSLEPYATNFAACVRRFAGS